MYESFARQHKMPVEASFLQLHNNEVVGVFNSTNATFVPVKQLGVAKFSHSIRELLSEIFLPKGYPQSVTPDYVQYQIWDTIQALASSMSGTLATAAVLRGAGVGDQTATVLAASLTWVIKDGVGMAGRILFAWIYGTSLDSDCKRWRLLADLLNDAAFCIDLLSAHLQRPMYIAAVCSSSVMRAIVGVAGGGTRMAVVRHQARRENLADVAAKDGSQETLVGIISLLLSLVLLPACDGHPTLVWSLFVLFTVVHLGANYGAVRSLQFDIFNEERLRIWAQHYAETSDSLSVKEVNCRESVFLSMNSAPKRLYGCSLQTIGTFESQMEISRKGRTIYLGITENEGAMAIADDSTPEEVLLAAVALELQLTHRPKKPIVEADSLLELLNRSGWNTQTHLLRMEEFTFRRKVE